MLLLIGPLVAPAQSHWPDPVFHDGLEGVAAGPFNDADAARFLAQATFGPTDADIAHLRAVGYQAWLNEQYGATPSSQLNYVNWVSGTLGENTGYSTITEAWLLGALGGPDPQFPNDASHNHTDQLRQRVALALSEIFVISDQNTLLDQHPDGLAWYFDILSNNAFGNFRTLLEQVTLSPEMGWYLNMLGNPKANLAQNQHPDENYAREVNQLFSIGLVMLNADGSVQMAAGKPVPTYDQSVITNFAHVFTGWNWADCLSGNFNGCGYHGLDFQTPMAPFAAWHDNGTDANNDIASKQLLAYPGAANGGVLGSGGTPQSDLAFALDNIFNHPNVGPFIGRQLIQRLVTSNPSPAYVQRIANVFNDDGSPSHVRGNLQAVVQAILLDPEARDGQFWNPATFGKLREPLLRMTHFWRAMGAVHGCGSDFGSPTQHFANQPYRYAGYSSAYALRNTIYGGVGQGVMSADSVFNFFKPGYLPPGEMTTLHLLGPEFQINTDALISNSADYVLGLASAAYGFDVSDSCAKYGTGPGEIQINRGQDAALAASGTGALLDRYNVRFMSGQMSPYMRQAILSYINGVGSSDLKIAGALMLILTSPEYMIQK